MEISCKVLESLKNEKSKNFTVLRKEFYPEYADEYLTEDSLWVRAFTRGWG